ncbi:PKD domain-containing protein [Amycolatopsis tolypomycina]|uniref:PKD domain-containing protein n=1 Tax=Amycolatopsis tolypomycina TaxID=208445 RepID=A0A1H4SUH6_9PSEU|nr:PQQ-dependent sugar dehydrogenase [Amycolatopsis tolypomycina]SEC47832.1 PKD domain-containing protein [Amycolatopsis tolypomycina]
MSGFSALRRGALAVAAVLAAASVPVFTSSVSPVAAAALPPDSKFQKVTLHTETSNPMALDVAPDGRVFYIDRLGDVKVVKPNGTTVLSTHLNVFTANESGGLNIALDPGFATNQWVYVYWSPNNAGNVDRLSRFTVNGDTIDQSTEKVVLDVPVQRAECCHHGAGLVIDKKNGNLWLALGDNTNPFASDGYSPLDQRSGRAYWDAQRTAGNTNSLSGKLLRIHPEANGTYTIPSGNLFAPGTAGTRPEIYSMGQRNPFRIGLDPKTGYPVVANYGPDAGSDNPNRGPRNTVEWDVVDKPGNAGWPFCIGPNLAYNQYNFATGASGAKFDCAGGPANSSPNNTGLTKLPPAVPAQIYYHYQADPAHFPQLSGGAPMAGPVYRFDPGLASARKWPVDFDGRAVFAEWNTSAMFTFQLDSAGTNVTSIDPLLPSVKFNRPMDFEFGPDGALYVIEWGTGYGGGNSDAAIVRVDYLGGGSAAPVAKATADRTSGPAPLTVNFSSAGSADPGGSTLRYSWNFGDGTTSTAANPSHTYAAGNYTAVLTVTNAAGATGTASVAVTSGNTAPTVTITAPPTGGLFEWGDKVNFAVTVSDPEDGTVDCAQVTVQAYLGHDAHGHPLDQYPGCTGQVQTTLSSGHSENDNLFYVLEASYTDKGGAGGAGPVTGRAQVILQPKMKQAEFFTATGRTADGKGTDTAGVTVEAATDPMGGGSSVAFVQDGDWWSVDPLALDNITGLHVRASSGGSGGTLEVRRNAPDGALVASVPIAGTGGWQNWQDFMASLASPPTGTGKLYFVARNPAGQSGAAYLFNVNWVHFTGSGVGQPGTPPSGKQIVGKPSTRCVEVPNSSTTNGTQVQLRDCTATAANQQWTYTSGKQLTVYGNKCLDASGQGTANGTQVIIWDCHNQVNQQWNVNANGTITGVQSGLCLDANAQGTANGTKIILWSCGGQANQQWSLR